MAYLNEDMYNPPFNQNFLTKKIHYKAKNVSLFTILFCLCGYITIRRTFQRIEIDLMKYLEVGHTQSQRWLRNDKLFLNLLYLNQENHLEDLK